MGFVFACTCAFKAFSIKEWTIGRTSSGWQALPEGFVSPWQSQQKGQGWGVGVMGSLSGRCKTESPQA